jgi:hypothetical protein
LGLASALQIEEEIKMSKYSGELDRRIQSDEAIEVTRKWFLEVMAEENLPWSELSGLEQFFLKDLCGAYTRWRELKMAEKATDGLSATPPTPGTDVIN